MSLPNPVCRHCRKPCRFDGITAVCKRRRCLLHGVAYILTPAGWGSLHLPVVEGA